MKKAAIAANNLTVNYGKFTAASGVSLIVQQGEIFGFLGPNGSGKTTIIKTLCGLVAPSSGTGSILGYDVANEVDEVRKHIGYMSQQFNLYEDLTVNENIDFYGGIYHMSANYLKQRKREVIGLLGLEPYADRRAGQLSGGWKQRLGLACAIIHKPEVVFLDEPTAGIDPVARRELWDLIFKLSGQGITFFVTTHYMDEAERCGRIGYIYYSKLIAYGTIDELKQIPDISPEGTVRLEVSCAAPSEALIFIKNLSYVYESTIYGQSIHVLMNANKSIDKFIGDLAAAGFGRAQVAPIEPSLEDVFVTLTNNLNKGKGPAPAAIIEASTTKPTKRKTKRNNEIFSGLLPVFKKECIHISRDLPSIMFVLIFTAIQSILLGFAVNANERQIKTVVYDMSQTQESRLLIDRFAGTDDFKIVKSVHSDKELYESIVAGESKVGIKIPVEYSRMLLEGRTADVLVLVDGSNANLTSEAVNISNGLMLQESLKRMLKSNAAVNAPNTNVPMEARHIVLFNPDTRTSSFILPGLIPLAMQGMLLILVSTAIVRERERGTMEQLYLTPARPLGIMMGKILPYGVVGLLLHSEMLLLSYYLFEVPLRGSYFLLLLFTFPFLLVVLGLGLTISVKARTLLEATQMAINLYMPSAFLSGYLFDFDAMPKIFQWIGRLVPATYYVETVRGILLRGAEFRHLWPNAVIMLVMGTLLILRASRKFGTSTK